MRFNSILGTSCLVLEVSPTVLLGPLVSKRDRRPWLMPRCVNSELFFHLGPYLL
jgi:hypothetical protein